ncbi:hypothetical protein QFW80_15455 [Luteimonas sp. M1R5S18]|uniref:Relaxation protein n=1 Tax=Luteimonas rhizosphaericola TaxID=3042024 RepID=A0ABT6JP90_9GAMM|nr:hypothetical protein [Luteimonas rhizosphaericola]MDH5831916.1 hypothetical protein [Luteimonas rhizosphaericola]
MDRDTIEEFVANAALLAAHLGQQCERAGARLQQTASHFERSVEDGRLSIAESTRAQVRASLAAEIPAALEALADGARQLQGVADRVQREQVLLEQRARWLGLKATGAVLLAALAVLAATGYVAWANLARAQDARVRGDVMQALAQVTITSCDGHPCLKLEDGLRRWAGNEAYVLVDTGADAAAAPQTR